MSKVTMERKTCPLCGGKGVVPGPPATEIPCLGCAGKGWVYEEVEDE